MKVPCRGYEPKGGNNNWIGEAVEQDSHVHAMELSLLSVCIEYIILWEDVTWGQEIIRSVYQNPKVS